MKEGNNLVNNLQLFFYFSVVPRVFENSPSVIKQKLEFKELQKLPCLLANFMSKPLGSKYLCVMQSMKKNDDWGGM